MRKKILFITGSMNQTSQMHQISKRLPEYDCWFSQVFSESPLINYCISHTSVLDGTVLSASARRKSEEYLAQNSLRIDYGAAKNRYDLVVYCSDMMIPDRMRDTKTIWVQEGMIDRYTPKSAIVKQLNLPPWFCADTSLNGSTNVCDLYCVASEGYKDYISEKGTDRSKIIVTGIPNYDNIHEFMDNDFPYHDYVMVATTDMRETFRLENRPAFIRKAANLADGRQLLFKLHPNELYGRALKEIRKNAPSNTLVFQKGNTAHMIANCCELITQYSTVVYIGIVLGKKVHSWFDVEELYRLAPMQNGGTSADNIATICRLYIEHKGRKKDFSADKSFLHKRFIHEEAVA